jgi:hypothetical protein
MCDVPHSKGMPSGKMAEEGGKHAKMDGRQVKHGTLCLLLMVVVQNDEMHAFCPTSTQSAT